MDSDDVIQRRFQQAVIDSKLFPAKLPRKDRKRMRNAGMIIPDVYDGRKGFVKATYLPNWRLVACPDPHFIDVIDENNLLVMILHFDFKTLKTEVRFPPMVNIPTSIPIDFK